jgi:hypothetical protein
VVVGDLRAEKAAREGMVRVTRHLHRSTVFDRHEHRASIRAIVRARRANDLQASLSVLLRYLRHDWLALDENFRTDSLPEAAGFHLLIWRGGVECTETIKPLKF